MRDLKLQVKLNKHEARAEAKSEDEAKSSDGTHPESISKARDSVAPEAETEAEPELKLK